jgi:hypothetical protein
VTPPPHTRAYSKKWQNELVSACDSGANFSAASTVFEGGGNGRGFGGFFFFWQCKAKQPGHRLSQIGRRNLELGPLNRAKSAMVQETALGRRYEVKQGKGVVTAVNPKIPGVGLFPISPQEARFTIKGTRFLGFPCMAARFTF